MCKTSIATLKLQVQNEHGIVGFTDLLNEVNRQFQEELNLKRKLQLFVISIGANSQFEQFQKDGMNLKSEEVVCN